MQIDFHSGTRVQMLARKNREAIDTGPRVQSLVHEMTQKFDSYGATVRTPRQFCQACPDFNFGHSGFHPSRSGLCIGEGDVFADEEAIAGLTRYVHEGGGVAGLHAATWASQGVPEFGEMMGATSGAHKYNGEMGALQIDDPISPLTKQFQGKGFEFLDEFYHYIPNGPYSREKVHVLLSIHPSRKDLPGNQYTNRPDNEYGMVWIRSYGKGRVFNIGLGHRPEFYDLEADTTPAPS
jgi:Trehalose utilisation